MMKDFNEIENIRRAGILILSLWVLIFFTVLAILSGTMVRQQIVVIENVEVRNKLYSLASSGMFMTIAIVSSYEERDATPDTDSLNDFWVDNPALFKGVRLDDGNFTIRNFNNMHRPVFGVIDEERKINLNHCDYEVLKRLLENVGRLDEIEAAGLAYALIDWRDSDDTLHNKEQGFSETVEYKNAGYKYTPRNSPFRILEEVLLVKGMNREVFSRIRGYITVFGSGKININTASLEVFKSMGFSDEVVDKLVSFRAGPDMLEGTQDDNVFSSQDDILDSLLDYSDLTEEEREELNEVISKGLFTTTSETFTALCTSKLDNYDLCGKIICVFDKNSRIKYWGTGYSRDYCLR